MLRQILKDQDFDSSDGIEEAIISIRDDLSFDGVRSVFQNWMSRLACVLENGVVCSRPKKKLNAYVS
jgi:hypothetical protein